MLDAYWEIMVYWHMKDGNKKCIRRKRCYEYPTDEEIEKFINEYAGDSGEVHKCFETLPFT